MTHAAATALLRLVSGPPALRVYGKAAWEPVWHVISVHATARRNAGGWPRPFWAGTCIAWTAHSVAVGWDFAERLLFEQASHPASRDHPVAVPGGRLRDRPLGPSASEVLAHECGHTGQARRWGPLYWPLGAAFTLFREGGRPWNWFENQASAAGLFGGIVAGSVCDRLMTQLRRGRPSWLDSADE